MKKKVKLGGGRRKKEKKKRKGISKQGGNLSENNCLRRLSLPFFLKGDFDNCNGPSPLLLPPLRKRLSIGGGEGKIINRISLFVPLAPNCPRNNNNKQDFYFRIRVVGESRARESPRPLIKILI